MSLHNAGQQSDTKPSLSYSAQMPIPNDDANPRPANKANNKSLLLFAGLGIVMMVGICCFAGILVVIVSRFSTDSSMMQAVYSVDRKSQLDVPANWKELSLNSEASIEYGHALNENYVILISQEKSAIKPNVGLGERRTRQNRVTLEDYGLAVVEQIRSGGDLMTATKEQKLTINGREAVQFRIEGKVDGLRVVYLVTIVEGRTRFYQIVGWTLENRMAKNLRTQKAIALSFQTEDQEELGYSGEEYH